jgi:hypothetical protein
VKQTLNTFAPEKCILARLPMWNIRFLVRILSVGTHTEHNIMFIAQIMVGAVGRVLKVERCERVQLVASAVRLSIASCHDCVFYLGVNRPPLLLGDNRFLQVHTPPKTDPVTVIFLSVRFSIHK